MLGDVLMRNVIECAGFRDVLGLWFVFGLCVGLLLFDRLDATHLLDGFCKGELGSLPAAVASRLSGSAVLLERGFLWRGQKALLFLVLSLDCSIDGEFALVELCGDLWIGTRNNDRGVATGGGCAIF